MPNARARNVVLIGDAHADRATFVKEIIEEEFAGTVVWAQSFDGLEEKRTTCQATLILLAHDLPNSTEQPASLLTHYLFALRSLTGIRVGCIIEDRENPELEGLSHLPTFIHVPQVPPTPDQKRQIIHELGTILSRPFVRPEVELEDEPSLREQVRSLSPKRDLSDGKRILGELTGSVFKCLMVKVKKLGQGLSGASVFRISPQVGADFPDEFVLKISSSRDFWKIKLEVDKYHEAVNLLGITNYKIHYPQLQLPHNAYAGEEHIVNHLDWYAICYDFLGDKFGTFIDLETALVTSEKKLLEKTQGTRFYPAPPNSSRDSRILVWDVALDWLCKNLYSKAGFIERIELPVWNTIDMPERQYVRFPPYQLSGTSKSQILSFLDSRAGELGLRLFSGWENHRQLVWSLAELSGSNTGVRLLDRSIPFSLSPAHGDLNANNLLLWLNEASHPFIIDLPYFQSLGHALQDFARLEVEIKFSLMDRQLDSDTLALPVFDFTHTQVSPWKEMEDHLLGESWADKKTGWRAGAYTENVELCLQLVQNLRARALSIQTQPMAGPAPVDFLAEYLPALLFHTIRAIGYGNLSVFKRLLAVYSASSILSSSSSV